MLLKLVKDSLKTFLTLVIIAVVGLVASIIVARALGPSGKGTYSLILLVPTFLASLGSLGIGIANVHFCRSVKHRLADLTSNSLVSSLVLGLPLAMAAIMYFYFFRPSFLGDISLPLLVIAALMTPLLLLFGNFRFLLLGEDKVNQYNLLDIIFLGLSCVLCKNNVLLFLVCPMCCYHDWGSLNDQRYYI